MNVKIFCDIFRKNHSLPDVEKLSDIFAYFKKIKDGINEGEVAALIIGDYLFANISSERVMKRKSSATEFEDFLDYAFNGKVTDNGTRQNLPVANLKKVSQSVANYISSNRREKMDVIFPSGYGLSLKTSVPDNNEINLGSFAREALFEGFLTPSEYGGERKGGLGSKPQIKKIFGKISKKGLWKKFCQRFEIMVNNIYIDDVVFVIKNDTKMEIYAIDGKSLRGALIKAVKGGPSSAVKVLNRYEGNSIRVERDKIINQGDEVELDFSKIEDSQFKKVLSHIKELEEEVLICLEKGDTKKCEKILFLRSDEILNAMK